MNVGSNRRGCRWPMWPHDSRPTHEYCGARRIEGSSYCEAHRQLSVRNPETEPRQSFVPNRIPQRRAA